MLGACSQIIPPWRTKVWPKLIYFPLHLSWSQLLCTGSKSGIVDVCEEKRGPEGLILLTHLNLKSKGLSDCRLEDSVRRDLLSTFFLNIGSCF